VSFAQRTFRVRHVQVSFIHPLPPIREEEGA
jgi:hypothetical protein